MSNTMDQENMRKRINEEIETLKQVSNYLQPASYYQLFDYISKRFRDNFLLIKHLVKSQSWLISMETSTIGLAVFDFLFQNRFPWQ